MDLLSFIFAGSLAVAGAVLIAIVRAGFSREMESEPRHRSAHQEAVRAERRMERRRDRVWWKMEVLHAEFVKSTSVGGSSSLPPASEVTPPAEERGVGVKASDGFTLKGVQGAYEMFQRKS